MLDRKEIVFLEKLKYFCLPIYILCSPNLFYFVTFSRKGA